MPSRPTVGSAQQISLARLFLQIAARMWQYRGELKDGRCCALFFGYRLLAANFQASKGQHWLDYSTLTGVEEDRDVWTVVDAVACGFGFWRSMEQHGAQQPGTDW